MHDCGAKVLVVSAELDVLPPWLPSGLCCFSAGNAAEGFESWDAAEDDAQLTGRSPKSEIAGLSP